jgi:hypothetical protein
LQRRQHTGEDGEEQEEHGGGGEIVERGRHCTSSLRRWLACRVQSSWFMVSAQALLWGTDQGQSQHGGFFVLWCYTGRYLNNIMHSVKLQR